MADEAIPVTSPSSSPVAPAAQTASPQSDVASPSASPTGGAVSSPAVTESAPVTTEVTPAADTSVLGTVVETKADPAPVAEVVKPADGTEPKKEEGNQSAEPAPLPSYEAFTLPEGFTLEEKTLGEFTKDLGEFQVTTKADQAAVQAFGQKLIDKYVTEMNSASERMNEFYTSAWEKTKKDWREQFNSDPEIGGNRRDTTIKAISQGLAQYGGTPEQQADFRQAVDSTGVGNHPALIRTFHNLIGEINRLKTKYESESGVKPLPGTKPQSDNMSKVSRRYGKSL